MKGWAVRSDIHSVCETNVTLTQLVITDSNDTHCEQIILDDDLSCVYFLFSFFLF